MEARQMTNKTYAELVAEVSISVTPNQGAFLSELVKDYIEANDHAISEIAYTNLINLIATLTPKAGC
jgi:DNA-binding transcriptional regulator YhcF (GntR family)